MPVGIVCIPTYPPPVPPQLDIPNFGTLIKGSGFMDKVMEPADLIAQMQDGLALALAPVRRYLEIVETFAAVQNCFKAIPESIMSLSPDPVIECLDKLRVYIARILSWIPPISYYAMGCDVAGYCIDAIDEILAMFSRMDTIIGNWASLHDSALAGGETVLVASTKCSARAVIPPLCNGLQMLIFAKVANEVLLTPFERLCPSPLGPAIGEIKKAIDMAVTYSQVSRALIMAGSTDPLPGFNGGAAGPGPRHAVMPTPGIAPVLEAMSYMRQTLVFLYNLIAPNLGRPEKANRSMPTFNYL